MPRYIYNCKSCDGYFQIWHGMKEVQESCQLCFENTILIRVPQIPSIKKENKPNTNSGVLVEDYIKQNQQLLKKMQKEAGNQTYDD